MLDAYERITLEAGARGLYRTTFTVPDTYGIFKFRVHYRRPGYTVLSFSTQVSAWPQFAIVWLDVKLSCVGQAVVG